MDTALEDAEKAVKKFRRAAQEARRALQRSADAAGGARAGSASAAGAAQARRGADSAEAAAENAQEALDSVQTARAAAGRAGPVNAEDRRAIQHQSLVTLIDKMWNAVGNAETAERKALESADKTRTAGGRAAAADAESVAALCSKSLAAARIADQAAQRAGQAAG